MDYAHGQSRPELTVDSFSAMEETPTILGVWKDWYCVYSQSHSTRLGLEYTESFDYAQFKRCTTVVATARGIGRFLRHEYPMLQQPRRTGALPQTQTMDIHAQEDLHQ